MAKGKKKGKSGKSGKKRLANHALVGTFAGGLLGKVVEKVLAETVIDALGIKRVAQKSHHGDNKGDKKIHDDVAARLLEALAAGGPRSIAQLLADTHLSLSPVLHALHTLRDFRLIHFVGEEGAETIEVTRSGAETVTIFRQNHIREEAAKLLHH